MFKLFGCLCFGSMFLTIVVLTIVFLLSPDFKEQAQILVNKLQCEVNPKFKEFEENADKWKYEVYDDVRVFDVKAGKDLKDELKRLNAIFDDLKKKNRKCVEDQKSKIAALSSIGWDYSTCSSHIESSTARNVEILLTQVLGLKSRSESLVREVKECKSKGKCLRYMIKVLKKGIRSLLSDIDKKVIFTKELINDKKNYLKTCFTVSKLTSAGDEIIKKINACAT